jgi:hypothetical protein
VATEVKPHDENMEGKLGGKEKKEKGTENKKEPPPAKRKPSAQTNNYTCVNTAAHLDSALGRKEKARGR